MFDLFLAMAARNPIHFNQNQTFKKSTLTPGASPTVKAIYKAHKIEVFSTLGDFIAKNNNLNCPFRGT